MLRDSISYLGNKLQSYLFPLLDDKLYDEEISNYHLRLVSILEVLQIEKFLPKKERGTRGKPSKHPVKIARAFIAKHVLNLKTTSQLIRFLKADKNLRYICGWDPYERIADESTFSRVFKILAESKVPEEIHESLAREVFKGHVVLHNGRDSVPIPVREWPMDKKGQRIERRKAKNKKEKKSAPKRLTVCEKQASEDLSIEEMEKLLPKICDIGRKVNSTGKAFCWRGYKLHLDVAEGWFPLSCLLTSASTHDTQAAIPLSKMSSTRSAVLYELMDTAYDSRTIKSYIEKKGRKPIISPRIWNGKRGEETSQELRAQKFLSFKLANLKRLEHRMCNERMFARLKDHFACMSVWVRGYEKVKCHVFLSILVLAADELLRFLC
jgi:transposase